MTLNIRNVGCEYHLTYPLHGSPPYMEIPLPTYDQVREEIHRETPRVDHHDLTMYYKDTIIMRILMRVHQLMTPYSPIFITQERHAYTLDTPFTPLEHEWLMSRLQQQHPSWMPEELEEAVERLGAQKLATCPCPEHMKRKSVAIINIPFIMRKVEPDTEDEADENEIHSEEKKEAQDVEVNNGEYKENPQNMEEETNSEKDSGFSGNNTSEDENEEELSVYKDADKPCPFCGQMHLPITQTVIPKSFGFIIRLTPK